MLYAVTSNGPDMFEMRKLVAWARINTCNWRIKNLYPSVNISETYFLSIVLKLGETFENFLLNKMTDATNCTITGIDEMANANAIRDGGVVLVNIYMIINEITFPMTGKDEAKAVFWNAEMTDVMTCVIILRQKNAVMTYMALTISSLYCASMFRNVAQSTCLISNSKTMHNGMKITAIIK